MDNEPRQRPIALAGWALAAVGFLLVVGGWAGIRGQGSVLEQLPYLASGGIGGLALILAGVGLAQLVRLARIERTLSLLAVRQEMLEESLKRFVAALNDRVDLEVPIQAAQARRRPTVEVQT